MDDMRRTRSSSPLHRQPGSPMAIRSSLFKRSSLEWARVPPAGGEAASAIDPIRSHALALEHGQHSGGNTLDLVSMKELAQ